MAAVPPPPSQCKLLAGPPAIVAQLLLAVLAFSSLVYKRCAASHTRPFLHVSISAQGAVVHPSRKRKIKGIDAEVKGLHQGLGHPISETLPTLTSAAA